LNLGRLGTAPAPWSPRRVRGAGLGALGTVFLGWLLFAPQAASFSFVWGAGLVVLAATSLLMWLPSSATRSWRRFVSETADLHVLGVALAFILAAPRAFDSKVTSDGCIYFSYLRSLVFDHDLSVWPEMDFLGLVPRRPHAIVPVGPIVLWAPLYLVVAAVEWISRSLNGSVETASGVALGLTEPYVRSVFVSSWLAASAGLVALQWWLRREFGRAPALVCSLLVVGATPLSWYLVYEVAMTHATSFGVVACALVASDAWFRQRLPSRRQAVAVGVLMGVALLVRPQDVVFLLFPLVAAAAGLRAGPWRAWTRALAFVAISAAPFLLMQVLWGALLASREPSHMALFGSTGYVNLAGSHWRDVLFSSRHGLLSWTPIVTVALIGTCVYVGRNAVWGIAALLAFATTCWVSGSTPDWWGGGAFGARRFISVVAALTPGLALVVRALVRRPMFAIAPLAAAFIVWNDLLMQQMHLKIMPTESPFRFETMVRQQVELYLRRPYFYPFAFPANAWFSWREGLPIDAYDLLGTERPLTSMDLPMTYSAQRYALDGWRFGGLDAFGVGWVMDADSATLVVPLSVPAERPYALEIRARAEHPTPGAPTCHVRVEVNGQPIGALMLDPAAQTPSRTTFTTSPADHDRVWRVGYNHVTFRRTVSGQPLTTTSLAAKVILYGLYFAPAVEAASSR
jgi:hypothetical protein